MNRLRNRTQFMRIHASALTFVIYGNSLAHTLRQETPSTLVLVNEFWNFNDFFVFFEARKKNVA